MDLYGEIGTVLQTLPSFFLDIFWIHRSRNVWLQSTVREVQVLTSFLMVTILHTFSTLIIFQIESIFLTEIVQHHINLM